jgi:hypothetical protein
VTLVSKIGLLKTKLKETMGLLQDLSESRKQALSKNEILSEYISTLKRDHKAEVEALTSTVDREQAKTKVAQS